MCKSILAFTSLCLLLICFTACQKESVVPSLSKTPDPIIIELELFGSAHRSTFPDNKWHDWGDELQVSWKQAGRIMSFEFPEDWNLNYKGTLQTIDPNCTIQSIHPKESYDSLAGMTFELPDCMMGQRSLFLQVHSINP